MIKILPSDVERHENQSHELTDEEAQSLRELYANKPQYNIRGDGSIWQLTLEDVLIRLIRLEKILG